MTGLRAILSIFAACAGLSVAGAQGIESAQDAGFAAWQLEPLPPVESVEEVPAVEEVDELDVPLEFEAEAVAWYRRELSLWEGNFELGLDGASGNSETLNIHSGFELIRTAKNSKLTLDGDYIRSKQNDVTTVNRFFLEGRHDLSFTNSRWIGFMHGSLEHDKFRAFDYRIAADMGWGYKFITTKHTTLIGRLGSGVSREINGPQNETVPEGLAGADFEHQLTRRQKLSASVEYFPDWTAPGEFRLNTSADWIIMLDTVANLSLKVGVTDRYDSTPNGASFNDLDYSLLLLWSF